MQTTATENISNLQGYNAGFNQAVNTFNEIILVLLVSQLVQVVTYRLIEREKPFSVTLRTPVNGEIIFQKGFDYEIDGIGLRVAKLLNQSVFTLALTLTAYLFVQTVFPAYTWQVIQ